MSEDEKVSGPALPPRSLVAVVTLVSTGIMGYAAYRSDYRSMIVAALVVLFTLGADLGAILRGWRGGGP